MQAFVVTPRRPGSGRLADVPEPRQRAGDALIEVVAVGVEAPTVSCYAGNTVRRRRATTTWSLAMSPSAASSRLRRPRPYGRASPSSPSFAAPIPSPA